MNKIKTLALGTLTFFSSLISSCEKDTISNIYKDQIVKVLSSDTTSNRVKFMFITKPDDKKKVVFYDSSKIMDVHVENKGIVMDLSSLGYFRATVTINNIDNKYGLSKYNTSAEFEHLKPLVMIKDGFKSRKKTLISRTFQAGQLEQEERIDSSNRNVPEKIIKQILHPKTAADSIKDNSKDSLSLGR